MSEIETGAKTLRDLAEWILGLPHEQQHYRVYSFDSEYGEEPWHGVVRVEDERVVEYEGRKEVHEPRAIISDSLTQEEFAELQAHQRRTEQLRRQEHWNRPEVVEAKEKGLLP